MGEEDVKGSVSDVLESAGKTALQSQVDKIVVETNVPFAERLVIDKPFSDEAQKAPPSPALTFARPKISVYDAQGKLVKALAPYGEPAGAKNWAGRLLVGGSVAALFVGAFGFGRWSK